MAAGPCLCGDTHCPSCGPAQGNSRCPVCGEWSDDHDEHTEDDAGGVCLHDDATCSAQIDELAEQLERDAQADWDADLPDARSL